jgi:beta-lactam-binding protein with PASTA domain/predicted Ser/Thr protein kinase
MDERLSTDTIVDGRYRVVERIGSGGMADVYRAEDLQLGRDVALKVLYRRFAEDPEFVERFRREASSAAGLQHPHVVSVYDRGEWGGTYYIAMEYLGGRSLKRVVQEEGPLPPALAVDLVTQILKAAKFAHRRGVVHRDLKPHNVIVDDEGRVKVTDFGIALAGASEMTQTGSIMGTAQYLSPEQAQGRVVTGQSDLYSIGVVLFELLTGRIPFDGDSAVTIALKQVGERPPAPSHIVPSIPAELDQVVLRALAKDPIERYADADAFMAALDVVARDLPAVGDDTAITAYQAGAVGGAMGAGFAAAAASDAQHTQVSGAIPAVSTFDGYAYPAAPPPEPEDDGGKRWWIALLVGLLVAAAIVGGLLLFGSDKVTVANVVGADEASAVQRLRTDGLSTEIVRRSDPRQPQGTVIGQNPQGGERLDEGEVVTLTVSDGPGTAVVPDLVGQGRNAATRALREAGFLVRERRQPSMEIGENRVIETSPESGTSLDKGQTVTLVVSTGAQRTQVPNVVGRQRDAAETALEQASLEVTIRETESDQPEGTVLAQTPAPGTRVATGTSVTITVAIAAEEVDVPDVVGDASAEAIAQLSAAGLVPNVQRREVQTPDQDDVVLEQSPRAGKRERGETVRIVIGRFSPDLDPDPVDPPATTPSNTPTTPSTTTPSP